MQTTSMNGINVEALHDTVKAVQAEPEIAAFTFRAQNNWVSGGVNRTVIDGYFGACEEHTRSDPFVLVNDEPPVLLGTDTAANPVEYVLHALAGCITTTLIAHATARGVKIDAVETRFVGELDVQGFLGVNPDVRNGYQSIKVNVSVKGDADDKTLADLVQVARNRSPVFDIVSNGVPVGMAVEVMPSQTSQAA